MMFRTELNIAPSPNKITLKHDILLIGSCFSEHIGQLLLSNKFNALTNPFGVIFNPISINKLLKNSMSNQGLQERGFGVLNEVHFHYDLHSGFSALSKNQLVKNFQEAQAKTHTQLKNAHWIIITWGTSIVYELIESDEIVANCHKVPAKQFSKRLLTVAEIVSNFEKLLIELPPSANIILTVSPVRHIKETIELNSVSKSTLRLAAHELSQKYEQVSYFPSFEILMDDLRDYRFYEDDMLHPNNTAIKYVWDKFSKTYFDPETHDFINEWAKISNALNHKPFNLTSQKHQDFIRNTIQKLESIADKVNVASEMNLLRAQLIK